MRRIIFSLYFALFSFAVWASDPCTRALVSVMGPTDLAPRATKRRLEDVQELRLGTYNTYNLLRSADGKYQKPLYKQEGLARPIISNDLDIIVVEEVNDLAEMQQFSQFRLGDKYESILADSNDSRGIKIGYFIKRDLPFRIEVTTSKDMEAVYPATGEVTKIYSRDLPGLRVWSPEQSDNDEPLLSLFGTHFKSKRDKPGDPESRILRRIQNEISALVVEKEMNLYPQSVVMVAGDFNGDVRVEPEFAPLKNILIDLFDAANPPMTDAERITHSFHPKEGDTKYSQIDAFLLAPNAKPYIKKAFVHRYLDANGNIKTLPATWEERNANPSDHFPVIFHFDFKKLLEDRGVLPLTVSWIHIRLLQAQDRPDIVYEPLVA